MDVAKKWIAQWDVQPTASSSAPTPFAVVAERQEKGRGRHQNAWASDEGGLYTTLCLEADFPSKDLPQVGMLGAAAVFGTLAHFMEGDFLQFKWPNDILCKGKKMAGILVEVFESHGKRYVLVGMGVNTFNTVADTHNATSLQEMEGMVLLDADMKARNMEIFERLLGSFQHLWEKWQNEGFAFLKEKLEKNSLKTKTFVEFMQDGVHHKGQYLGLSPEGGIMIQTTKEAAPQVFFSGQIHTVRLAHAKKDI